MIVKLIVSSAMGALIIIFSFFLRLKKLISNETERKLVHIAHAIVVVSWIFITTYNFIIWAEILFVFVVLAARYFKFMQSLRTVNRRTWGELFFAGAIIIIALMSPSKLVFTAAMLHLGLADALAAIVGTRVKKGVYHVFGQRKSIAGTATFFIVSFIIMWWLIHFKGAGYPLAALVFVPLITTIVENISPYGSDNLTIPLVTANILILMTPFYPF